MLVVKLDVDCRLPFLLTEPVQFGSVGVLDAVHVLASVTVHVKVVADPLTTEVDAALNVTLGWTEVILIRIAFIIV